MNDHNLDDLIIEEEISQGSDKTKGILTIVALLIVVLIIAIAFTKVVLKEPKVDAVVKNDSAKFRSPDLKVQKHKIKKDKKSDIVDTQDIDTKPKVVQRTEIEKPVIKHTTPKVEEESEPIVEAETKPIAVEKPDSEDIVKQKPKPVVEKVVITDEFEQVETKVDTTPKVSIKPVKPVTLNKPKPVVHSPVKTDNAKYSKYYIQVGSFSKEPNGKFLGVIKKSGFHYTILPTSRGVKKLLIGPYKSRAEVDKALPQVRDRINKSAFVYKAK